MQAGEPDPDWYIDHVLLAALPGGGLVGPARSKQAAWQRRLLALEAESAGRHALIEGFAAACALASTQGFVLTRAQARTCGLDEPSLRSLARGRRWTVVRRSVFCPLPAAALDPGEADGAYAGDPAICASAAALVRAGTWISHESAALACGLPVLDVPARPVLTHPRVASAEGRSSVLLHAAPVTGIDREQWFGAAITSVARCVVDVARCSGADAGIVVADAALREQLTTRARLRECIAGMGHWPGVRAARLVTAIADPGAESPLESLARLCLHRAGLPAPTLQHWIPTAGGRFRVDMLWAAERVVVELDGMIKYTARAAGAGGSPLAREKRRQEWLGRAGYVVVRLTWDDVVSHPGESADRVRRALAGGR